MKAVLEINKNDLNMHLVEVLNALFKRNVTEIVIRKSTVKLDEFDKSLNIEDVMQSLKDYGHNIIIF